MPRNLWGRLKDFWAAHKPLILSAALIVLLDRVTKVLAVWFLIPNAWEPVSWFHLRYVENTGMAFGLMQNGNLLLIFIMLGVVAYLLYSWKELSALGACARWGMSFILAGAIGNLYDRITLGFVIDFLDFRIWPVFNVADSFITVGGCLLALSVFFATQKKGEEK